MLRRSNSSSHIPVPRTESRARSKSSVRISGRETGLLGGKSNVIRGSTEKIPLLKRSTSSTALKKSSLLTPTVQPRSSIKRLNSQTPSSSSKSPWGLGSGKSDRYINDKKWVSEQFTKVKNYLQEYTNCHDEIIKSLKPPTINTFVLVMELLLREVDSRISLTTANYKEVVVNCLKMLHYPMTISNSLLKTVNTMHAWPQVISIFAWLVDLIEIIKRAELHIEPIFETDIKRQKIECVSDYIIDKYILYNTNEDESLADVNFTEKYVDILKIDEEEISRLNKEVADLNTLKEKQMDQIRDIQSKNDLLKKEIDNMEYQIETFYAYDEEKQDDIDHTLSYLKQKKPRLINEIKGKQEHIRKLNEAIAKQLCTYEEKVQLKTHVDQLMHTLDLKKQRFATKKELKANCDAKMAEAKKKVETDVYRLNNELMQLAMVEPKLKTLQLRENYFIAEEFKDEIRAVIENKKLFEKKINDEKESVKTAMSQCASNNEHLKYVLEDKIREFEELTKPENKADHNIKTYASNMQNFKVELEIQTSRITEEIKTLVETIPDDASAQLELTHFEEVKATKDSDLTKLAKDTEDLMIKLREEVLGNVQQMNELRTRVFDHMAQKLNRVDIEGDNVYNELLQLLSIGDIKKEQNEEK